MKKPYNNNNSSKGIKRIHPSPLPPSTTTNNPLSALPTALLALATALSAEDQEVLAYLLSCQQKPDEARPGPQLRGQQQPKAHGNHHPPELGCSCFTCYKSFWARWDASPNRHVIHLIIDDFEQTLESSKQSKGKINSSRKKKKKTGAGLMNQKDDAVVLQEENIQTVDAVDDDEKVVQGEGKSSVSRFVSWVFGISNHNN